MESFQWKVLMSVPMNNMGAFIITVKHPTLKEQKVSKKLT